MLTAFWIQNMKRISILHTPKNKESLLLWILQRDRPGFQGQITINLNSDKRVQEQLEITHKKKKMLESLVMLLHMECQFLHKTPKFQVWISTVTKHLPTTGRLQKRSDLSHYQKQTFLPHPTSPMLLKK